MPPGKVTKKSALPYSIQSISAPKQKISFQVKPLTSAPLPYDNYGHQYAGNVVASHSTADPGYKFKDIKVGDVINVKMANGQVQQFKIVERKNYKYNDYHHPEQGVSEQGHKMSWNDMMKGVTQNPQAVVLQYSHSQFSVYDKPSKTYNPSQHSIGANFLIAVPLKITGKSGGR